MFLGFHGNSFFNVAVRYVAGVWDELPVFFDAEYRRAKFF